MMSHLPSTRILIVEDDLCLRMTLQEALSLEGYETATAIDGEAALELMMQPPGFDLVLLSLMLPKKNGFEVLREARRRGIRSPVMVLTARGDEDAIVQGLRLGADDCVTKPFSAQELGARIKAVLKRTLPPHKAPMDVHRIGEVEINFSTHEAYRNGDKLHFTAMEFNLLRYLVVNRGRAVSRKELLHNVWNLYGDLLTRTIDRHMAALRKKIEPNHERPMHIETVYGVGYRLAPAFRGRNGGGSNGFGMHASSGRSVPRASFPAPGFSISQTSR